jgi:putative FmdB family regulatory protein
MPLYEYECDACGHRFEVIQKYSDPLVDTCPKCGSTVHKLISSPAIQFKGSGFYITDYPKKESGGGPKSSGGAKDQDPSSKSASSSESSDKGSEKSSEKGSDKSKGSEKAAESKSDKGSTGDSKAAAPAAAAAPAKKD